MKEITRELILAVALFSVKGDVVGNWVPKEPEYKYVVDYIDKTKYFKDKILALRLLYNKISFFIFVDELYDSIDKTLDAELQQKIYDGYMKANRLRSEW